MCWGAHAIAIAVHLQSCRMQEFLWTRSSLTCHYLCRNAADVQGSSDVFPSRSKLTRLSNNCQTTHPEYQGAMTVTNHSDKVQYHQRTYEAEKPEDPEVHA